jgi:hypothetical protein
LRKKRATLKSIMQEYLPFFTALAGAAIGGTISILVQIINQRHQIKIIQLQQKTDFAAEETARYFLSHRIHIERSFETIRKSIGGFEEDELRKILVRAGAIRSYREDGSEWWKLLSRMDEYLEKKLDRT